jgi:hypothetical protein
MKSLITALAAGGLLLCLAGEASAGLVTFDLTAPTGSLGTTHTFHDTTNTFSITATAFTTSSSITRGLWVKADGSGESGLGTLKGSDHEIDTKNWVQLDLSSVIPPLKGPETVTIQSLTKGESALVFQSLTPGTEGAGPPGTLLTTVTSPPSNPTISFTLDPSKGLFLDFIANSHPSGSNFLIEKVTLTTTPEPSSYALLAVGGLALGGFGWLRRRKAAVA